MCNGRRALANKPTANKGKKIACKIYIKQQRTTRPTHNNDFAMDKENKRKRFIKSRCFTKAGRQAGACYFVTTRNCFLHQKSLRRRRAFERSVIVIRRFRHLYTRCTCKTYCLKTCSASLRNIKTYLLCLQFNFITMQ